MKIVALDQISEVPSEILYIKRFFGRVALELEAGGSEIYIAFALEKRPVGPPDITITFLEETDPEILAGRQAIEERILAMEKSGELKHSPFEGL